MVNKKNKSLEKTLNNKETDKSLQKDLNEIISTSLYGGGSDPGWEGLYVSTLAYKQLKRLGLKVKGEKDIVRCLTKENNYNENFLE